LNSKSEKFVLQKFNREFTDILLNILKQQQLPLKIYREPFNALLAELGCMKGSSSMDVQAQKSKALREEIWLFLRACQSQVSNGIEPL